MLLIVANHQDQVAAELVRRWEEHDACLLTPRDLSAGGWRYDLPALASCAVIGGRRVEAREIRAVLTRLPRVYDHDLPHIVEEDRRYLAAEMTAFLTAWLTHLPCPVLNRPSTECLAGRNWRREQWVLLAARMGMRVLPISRRTGIVHEIPSYESLTHVAVVGEHVVGRVDPLLAEHARRLARAAGVEMLSAQFDGAGADAVFVDANSWPDMLSADVADAALAHLLRGTAC